MKKPFSTIEISEAVEANFNSGNPVALKRAVSIGLCELNGINQLQTDSMLASMKLQETDGANHECNSSDYVRKLGISENTMVWKRLLNDENFLKQINPRR